MQRTPAGDAAFAVICIGADAQLNPGHVFLGTLQQVFSYAGGLSQAYGKNSTGGGVERARVADAPFTAQAADTGHNAEGCAAGRLIYV